MDNNIGWAVEQLRRGNRIARSGWNEMWLFLVPGGFKYPAHNGEEKEMMPYVLMKTADDKIVPWLCSQSDLLANDWVKVI